MPSCPPRQMALHVPTLPASELYSLAPTSGPTVSDCFPPTHPSQHLRTQPAPSQCKPYMLVTFRKPWSLGSLETGRGSRLAPGVLPAPSQPSEPVALTGARLNPVCTGSVTPTPRGPS